MKQFIDCADILVAVPCYLGYLCMADKFCKKNLGTSKKNEMLFVIFSFVGWLTLNIINRCFLVQHIFFVIVEHILFIYLWIDDTFICWAYTLGLFTFRFRKIVISCHRVKNSKFLWYNSEDALA